VEFYTTISSIVKNMTRPIFEQAAHWVHSQAQSTSAIAATAPEIADAISTLHVLIGKCAVPMMVPDLFPGIALETVYVPKSNTRDDVKTSSSGEFNTGTSRVTAPALSAIGAAIVAQLERTGEDMVLYEFDDGARAIAYLPQVRDTVLTATGLVLLSE